MARATATGRTVATGRHVAASRVVAAARSRADAQFQPTSPLPDWWLIGDSQHYQDTARTTPVTAHGDPIGSASDSATTGPYHPSQATAGNRPTLALNAFKGHAGIAYAVGLTQSLSHATAPLTNSRSKDTVILCFRSDYASPPGGAIFSTTQDQLALMSYGRIELNSAAGEYGDLPQGATFALVGTGGQIVSIVYDGTQTGNANRLRCFRNLTEEILTYNGTIPATTYAGGQTLYLGREAGGSSWPHTLLEALVFRGVALTTAERQAWENWLAYKYFTKTTKQLVVSGDSNAVGSPNQTANPWPKRVSDTLGWLTASNDSTVGFKLSQAAGSINAGGRDDWLQAQPFVLALGTNDLAVDHASLETLQGYWNTIKSRLTGSRFPIFVCTIPASDAIAGLDETTRVAANAWLPTQSGWIVIDAATALGGAPSWTNFEGDHLHLNDAGHTVVKNAVIAALQAAGYA